MKYKLIAMDMDGTLLSDEKIVTARTKEALKKAEAAGVKVTLATGRMYCSAKPFADELEIKVPIISYNGAMVVDPETKEILLHDPIPYEIAMKIIKIAEEMNVHANVYLEDKLYVKELNELIAFYTSIAKVPAYPVGTLSEFFKSDLTKMLFVAEPEVLEVLREKIKATVGKEVEITKSHPKFLEVMYYKVNKGKAVAKVAEKLGIKQEEVITFGDNFNDLAMIEYAGLGVAMANAPKEVQEKADMVALSNNEDGVARVIEEVVLS